MPVEDREAFPAADVPEEVTRLFPSEAVDLRDEPRSGLSSLPESIEGLGEDRTRGWEESLSRSHDVTGLVIVEPRARSKEPRHLAGAAGPEQAIVRERPDRRIRGPRLRLDREDAETHLLEQPFVGERSDAAEFGEPRLDRFPFLGPLGPKGPQVSVLPHDAKIADDG